MVDQSLLLLRVLGVGCGVALLLLSTADAVTSVVADFRDSHGGIISSRGYLVGCTAALVLYMLIALVFVNQRRRIHPLKSRNFRMIMVATISGLFLITWVTIALVALPVNDAVCDVTSWLVILGYALMTLPYLVRAVRLHLVFRAAASGSEIDRIGLAATGEREEPLLGVNRTPSSTGTGRQQPSTSVAIPQQSPPYVPDMRGESRHPPLQLAPSASPTPRNQGMSLLHSDDATPGAAGAMLDGAGQPFSPATRSLLLQLDEERNVSRYPVSSLTAHYGHAGAFPFPPAAIHGDSGSHSQRHSAAAGAAVVSGRAAIAPQPTPSPEPATSASSHPHSFTHSNSLTPRGAPGASPSPLHSAIAVGAARGDASDATGAADAGASDHSLLPDGSSHAQSILRGVVGAGISIPVAPGSLRTAQQARRALFSFRNSATGPSIGPMAKSIRLEGLDSSRGSGIGPSHRALVAERADVDSAPEPTFAHAHARGPGGAGADRPDVPLLRGGSGGARPGPDSAEGERASEQGDLGQVDPSDSKDSPAVSASVGSEIFQFADSADLRAHSASKSGKRAEPKGAHAAAAAAEAPSAAAGATRSTVPPAPVTSPAGSTRSTPRRSVSVKVAPGGDDAGQETSQSRGTPSPNSRTSVTVVPFTPTRTASKRRMQTVRSPSVGGGRLVADEDERVTAARLGQWPFAPSTSDPLRTPSRLLFHVGSEVGGGGSDDAETDSSPRGQAYSGARLLRWLGISLVPFVLYAAVQQATDTTLAPTLPGCYQLRGSMDAAPTADVIFQSIFMLVLLVSLLLVWRVPGDFDMRGELFAVLLVDAAMVALRGVYVVRSREPSHPELLHGFRALLSLRVAVFFFVSCVWPLELTLRPKDGLQGRVAEALVEEIPETLSLEGVLGYVVTFDAFYAHLEGVGAAELLDFFIRTELYRSIDAESVRASAAPAENPGAEAEGAAGSVASQRLVAAIEIYQLFLSPEAAGRATAAVRRRYEAARSEGGSGHSAPTPMFVLEVLPVYLSSDIVETIAAHANPGGASAGARARAATIAAAEDDSSDAGAAATGATGGVVNGTGLGPRGAAMSVALPTPTVADPDLAAGLPSPDAAGAAEEGLPGALFDEARDLVLATVDRYYFSGFVQTPAFAAIVAEAQGRKNVRAALYDSRMLEGR